MITHAAVAAPRTSRHRAIYGQIMMVALAVGLNGCTAPVTQDGPPRDNPDVTQIPDATPRQEPLSPYGNPDSYTVDGQRYYVRDTAKGYRERGIASWYGRKFHGKRTSSGEPYDMYAMTAAHRTLPLPTYARVTNLRNGRSVIVRINDRGPFHDNRLIDLSYTAATKLGIVRNGTGLVEVRTIEGRIDDETPKRRWAKVGSPHSVGKNVDLYLQVAAFMDRINAERLLDRLRSAELSKLRVEQAQHPNGTRHRVRIGPLESVAQADQLAESLERMGLSDFRVVIE